MEKFNEFVDKKEREAKHHLKTIKKLLAFEGLKVVDYLGEEDPYIFVRNPGQNVTFDGIRIYQIGSQIAFRIQKEEGTEPFGKAYPLDIEKMFDDLMENNHKPEVAGKKVIEAVGNEIKQFFTRSAEAEKDLRGPEFSGNNPLGKIAIRSTGSDYANMIYSKG